VVYYASAEESRTAGVTYHLIPEEVWAAVQGDAKYTPEAYAADGFIHCTNGIEQMVTVANWFYVRDARAFKVLALDVPAIASEIRYDDAERLFPHIYGPLNLEAVIAVLDVVRSNDGTFVSITPPAE